MRHKRANHVTKTLFWTSAAGLIVGSALLLLSSPATTRAVRLKAILNEISRGNYYAWAQASIWWEKLEPQERQLVSATCSQYGLTNRVLYARANLWPPEPVRSPLARIVLPWLRGITGLKEHGLNYEQVISSPAFREIPVDSFDAMLKLEQAKSP